MTTVSNTRSGGHGEKLDEISPFCMEEHVLNEDSSATSSNFDCSICLEVSQDPVVTMCGHLFCWSCLHRWITIHSLQDECPVCKACVKDKIIPLYGRGKTGLTEKPQLKEALDLDTPRRPSAHSHYPSAPRVPRNAGFHYHGFVGQQSHGFIAQENFSTSSVAAFGLFPALFGIHMVTSPSYNGGLSSGTTVNSLSFRLPAAGRMTSQQRRLNYQQEFVLYWCLILLAGFATLCFLLF